METKEELELLADAFIKSRPTRLLKEVSNTNAGIGLALKLLYNSANGCLTAGEISETMGVSTARVAVLLKKMEKEGLIIKETHKADARITWVSISETGKKKANEMKQHILERIETVIEKIGEDKFRQFIALSVDVKNAIGEDFPPKLDIEKNTDESLLYF